MSEPAIEISHLTKTFRRVQRHYGLKAMLLHLPQYIRDRSRAEPFKALDDVSLTINRGERIGLAGHNGCGKTTLLSVIGGVYKRYSGSVRVRGRVSMMLALGAGFNNQLSGRDNILLNGILQGRTRAEMLELMPSIIDFADIGQFIDAPLYQYSSGMLARLGFSVATAIEPDILLVDEVMAVGDADFRKKCATRIDALLSGGTTLILVSHSASDLKRHCRRIVTLDHGRIVSDVSNT
ncbi:MAG: ABC transporter ATP-binding protein [Kiritimatiellae bacterium]|nr:ABC transporter ATP-binding protein [Kiritimatiellia bacterium]